jgi:hypothetical protein
MASGASLTDLAAVGGGLAAGGLLGGGITYAVVAGLKKLGNPVSAVKTYAMVKRLTQGTTNAIKKSVGEYVKAAKAGVRPMAAPVTTNVLSTLRYEPQARKRKAETRSQAMSNRIDELNAQVNNPQLFMQNLEKSVGIFSRDLPNTTAGMTGTATRALGFLKSKAPTAPDSMAMIKRGWKPSNGQITKFERYAAAVENPLGVLDDLKRGTVNHEQVEALRVVYPSIYNEIVSTLVENIPTIEDKLGYKERVQLSILFDVPVEQLAKDSAINKLQASMGIDPDQEIRDRLQATRGIRTGGVAKMKTYKDLETKAASCERT